MPSTKGVTPRQLSVRSLSVGVGDGPAIKLQFPPLPQEWKDRYVPGQMYKYQVSLPKLPVPPLQQTLQKYITSVEVCSYPIHEIIIILVRGGRWAWQVCVPSSGTPVKGHVWIHVVLIMTQCMIPRSIHNYLIRK